MFGIRVRVERRQSVGTVLLTLKREDEMRSAMKGCSREIC